MVSVFALMPFLFMAPFGMFSRAGCCYMNVPFFKEWVMGMAIFEHGEE